MKVSIPCKDGAHGTFLINSIDFPKFQKKYNGKIKILNKLSMKKYIKLGGVSI